LRFKYKVRRRKGTAGLFKGVMMAGTSLAAVLGCGQREGNMKLEHAAILGVVVMLAFFFRQRGPATLR
jgi:hypothetical protein